jgi:hypothetical protein
VNPSGEPIVESKESESVRLFREERLHRIMNPTAVDTTHAEDAGAPVPEAVGAAESSSEDIWHDDEVPGEQDEPPSPVPPFVCPPPPPSATEGLLASSRSPPPPPPSSGQQQEQAAALSAPTNFDELD